MNSYLIKTYSKSKNYYNDANIQLIRISLFVNDNNIVNYKFLIYQKYIIHKKNFLI